MNAQETMRENATLQELAQLALHETRDAALPSALPGQEGFELFGNYLIEIGFSRIAGNVVGGGITDDETVLMLFAAVVSDWRFILKKRGDIWPHHGSSGLPRC